MKRKSGSGCLTQAPITLFLQGAPAAKRRKELVESNLPAPQDSPGVHVAQPLQLAATLPARSATRAALDAQPGPTPRGCSKHACAPQKEASPQPGSSLTAADAHCIISRHPTVEASSSGAAAARDLGCTTAAPLNAGCKASEASASAHTVSASGMQPRENAGQTSTPAVASTADESARNKYEAEVRPANCAGLVFPRSALAVPAAILAVVSALQGPACRELPQSTQTRQPPAVGSRPSKRPTVCLEATQSSAVRLTRWPAAPRAARRAHPPQPGGDARHAWRRRGAGPPAATAAAATAAPRGRAVPAARGASPAPVHALARAAAGRALCRRASRAAGAAPAACQPHVRVAAAGFVCWPLPA